MVPCTVCDLKFRLDFPEAEEIQIVVTGMAMGICEPNENKVQCICDTKKTDKSSIHKCALKNAESHEMIFKLDEESAIDVNPPITNGNNVNTKTHKKSESPGNSILNSSPYNMEWRPTVVMTPLAIVPGGSIKEYLGNLDFIFVRESTSVREQGGLNGFLHTFITEVLTIVRAHVTALSGNAIVAFYMTELILSDNPHKNQAQCLVSVGGDVVLVSYLTNDCQ